ncbi:MAG: oxidoreductase [Rhodospirillales bacterium]|nr:oxidoreductase [Rhodospirillales bacterium]
MFKALLLTEEDARISSALRELEDRALPEGDVTVRVSHSTLNYKDGMIVNGIGRLVRRYPHVPGVDFAGIVEQSDHPDYKPGDAVVLTGWRVGETHWGGYAERARVKADWLVPLPQGLSARQAMAVGTAGFTAMLAQKALETHGVTPGRGPILVTGAAGGVGSVAVSLLSKAGFEVAAVTGRPEQADYLKSLGAGEIVARDELTDAPSRPLDKERWAGCIDNVGGDMLAHVLTQMAYGSAVASVGLAGGNVLKTTLLPLLLRGVAVLGIDSVMCPKDKRIAAWARIARDLDRGMLAGITETASLEEVPALAKAILKGQVRGRKVIEI